MGDPTSTPLCSETQLNADSCPAASQIGTTTTDAAVLVPKSAIQVRRKKITVDAPPDTEQLRIRAGGHGVKVKTTVGSGDELAFSIDVTDTDANHFSIPTPAVAR